MRRDGRAGSHGGRAAPGHRWVCGTRLKGRLGVQRDHGFQFGAPSSALSPRKQCRGPRVHGDDDWNNWRDCRPATARRLLLQQRLRLLWMWTRLLRRTVSLRSAILLRPPPLSSLLVTRKSMLSDFAPGACSRIFDPRMKSAFREARPGARARFKSVEPGFEVNGIALAH
jgi:hypothetical protein